MSQLKQNNLLFAFVFLLFISCNISRKESPELQEAAKVHTQAIKIEKELKPQLEQLIQIKNSINVQGRALTSQELALVTQIESIEHSYAFWEEHHVEVPGHIHHHDHAHHNHGAKLELAPADMLAVQREFRDSIVAIRQRVAQTLQLARSVRDM